MEEVRQIQRSIYLSIKKRALALEGKPAPELSRYRKAQEKLSNQSFQAVPLAELFEQIDTSRVIYLGDFHTFDQSSRTLERLLRHMMRSKKRTLALGMEMVNEKHQLELDSYIQGLITEQEFLESINYQESWRFPWKHYRPFFELARKRGLEIIALNSKGPLSKRDERASTLISNYTSVHPDTTLLVLFGELHIVADKLPKQVAKKIAKNTKQCIIHQNLDGIYWNSGGDDASLVRFNKQEFSLQSSPPWVKYESMLYWYENLAEDVDYDMHQSVMESAGEEAAENFLFYCGKINRSFNLGLNEQELEDFNLFDQEQLDVVLDRLSATKSSSLLKWQKEQIRRAKAFKFISSRDYYSPHFSVNRLAYLAGLHLHDHLRKQAQMPGTENALQSKIQHKRFLGFFHPMLLAYLCAKVINPFRKCDLYQDFLMQSRQAKLNPKKRENLKVVLALFALKHGETDAFNELLKGKTLNDLAFMAKRLAHAVADTLYHEFFTLQPESFQRITRKTVVEPWDSTRFITLLRDVFPGKSYLDTKKRFF